MPPAPGANKFSQLKQLLLAHYSAPPALILRRFRDGAIYFGVGLGTVLMAGSHLPPSLAQELLVLAGLGLLALGFLLAMLAETRFIISRILAFVRRK